MNESLEPKRKIEAAYDNFAKKYELTVGSAMSSYATLLFRDLQISEEPVVLDIGCGTGIATFELIKKAHGKGRFYGIDLSEKMVDIAKSRAKESGQANVEFSKGEAEKPDFPESSFDIIVSNQVFHWVQNKKGLVEAMFRLLKPDGKGALIFQGGPSFDELFKAYDRVSQRHPEHKLFERPRSLSLEETEGLFEEAGFKINRIFAIHEITYINPSLFWTNNDLTTSPWKIGLSLEIAKQVQREVAWELLKIKPENPLRTTVYDILVYVQKPSNL